MPTQARALDSLAELLDPLLDDLANRVAARIGLPQNIQPRLLTVEQAGTYLGRSKEATRHLIRTGCLPCVKADSRVMLDRQDLDKWIEDNKA